MAIICILHCHETESTASLPRFTTMIELDFLSYLFQFFDGIVMIQLDTLLDPVLLIAYNIVLCKSVSTRSRSERSGRP